MTIREHQYISANRGSMTAHVVPAGTIITNDATGKTGTVDDGHVFTKNGHVYLTATTWETVKAHPNVQVAS